MKQFPGSGPLHRTATVQKSAAGGVHSVAVSSEVEVTRNGWFGKWREVLDHTPGAVEMARFQSGSAAVLVDHGGDQVGVIESASLDADRVLRARIRFSANQRGQEIERDVVDGIRQNISVGYLPKTAKLVEEDKDRGDLWRITAWEPMELSIVSVPADPTVGVGRSADRAWPAVQIEEDNVEHTELQEIIALATGNGMAHRIEEWTQRGLSVKQVMGEILAARKTSLAGGPGSESLEDLGVPEKDLRRYSVSRAIVCAADGKMDGLEGAVHDLLAKRAPEGARLRGGVLVPLSLGLSKRSLVTDVVSKGAETVSEQVGDTIELLRNRTAVIVLGARVLAGLTAPISFPKQSGAMAAVWTGENAPAISESDMALALALMAGKTLMAATSWSRQLLIQSSLDVEAMVRSDIANVHALALDLAAIHGLGAAGEPVGIYKAVGVSVTPVGGAMTYQKVIALQGQVASANGDNGSLGWLCNPMMASNLMLAQRFTSTDTPVWTGGYRDGRVGGFPAFATNQVSKTMSGSERTGGTEIGAVFGNFNDLIIGTWGALELVVDPYTSKKKGLIEVASFQMCDILVRHGESFSKATGATS